MTAVEIGNLALACCDCNHDCSSNQPSPVPAVTVKLSDYCHFRCWPIRSRVPDAGTPTEIKKVQTVVRVRLPRAFRPIKDFFPFF